MSTILLDAGSLKYQESITGFGDDSEGLLKNTDPEYIPEPRGSGVIDVVNNFSWYSGPKASVDALNKIPRAFITERRQELNSLISGALYYLNVIGKTGSNVTPERVKSLLSEVNESIGIVSKTTDRFKEIISSFTGSADKTLLEKNNLLSLMGID